MVTSRIWRNLLALESRDLVQRYFSIIHGRELNSRRAREITSSSSQSREYFVNAMRSDNLVKPLLLFYGVVSLSRSLTLLLNKDGGEETLSGGHGLETRNWKNTLGGDLIRGLESLPELEIQTCSGTFSDLLISTNNTTCLHIHSASVDWRISYSIPEIRTIINLGDILSRTPDLEHEYTTWSDNHPLFFYAQDLQVNKENGIFLFKVLNRHGADIKELLAKDIYEITRHNQWFTLHSSINLEERHIPLFVNSYLNKAFDAIPNLYVAVPFSNNSRFSQLASSYMLAYTLGMLARYFPTQWTAMVRGEKGDALWPTINTAVSYIENAFPELVWEYIADRMKLTRKK